MESNFLFVYGTLKRHKQSPLKHQMRLKANYLEDVETCGDLYLVSYYPGLVLGGQNKVHGELYEIIDKSLIERLDEYEGCSSKCPLPHEYRRTLLKLQTSFGKIDAWTYEYIQSVKIESHIESGNF